MLLKEQVEQVEKEIAQISQKKTARSVKGLTKHQISLLNICEIITKAMPVLKLVKSLFWWRPKIQQAIGQVIGIAAMTCGIDDEGDE